MHKKDSKIVIGKPSKTVKTLSETHDMEEKVHLVQIDSDTGRVKFKYEAEGDPLPHGWDGEPLTKEWVLKQIKSSVGEAVVILRSEINQKFDESKVERLKMEKRIEQKFDESKVESQQMEKRIEQKFDDANSKSLQMEKRIEQRFEKVEKQNKDTNDKLEAILELLKKKDK
ncbi:hypothetical protein [Mycoplasmopsis agassizii]|nr:hypothetical protein [Mycoplasmopsis agassizii]SMC17966.1 hypothetical protein SAMN02745179_00569 [Mycoplasmopsis agassizii]